MSLVSAGRSECKSSKMSRKSQNGAEMGGKKEAYQKKSKLHEMKG